MLSFSSFSVHLVFIGYVETTVGPTPVQRVVAMHLKLCGMAPKKPTKRKKCRPRFSHLVTNQTNLAN